MIGYVTLGTNDLGRASQFYDELLKLVGAGQAFATDRLVAWANDPAKPMLCVIKPFNGEQATVGNGMMVSLQVDKPEIAQALHAKALSLGGSDEGAPGERMPGFYAAYFRDLDGNKLCAFSRG
ncbi:Catechol 2,3-dioxygenase [Solimonas aquatica]|uniref:Catechol 2,3-dioxygenase n=1 Tax=Solimonas aquatica TaxID=489703 RepID=A0A1H9H8K4_9GAMM|nr:VOC family protein [Solimonas aquatica]SEQ58684.1 Catechol 2,3-dioxygenase [Solimonas aquatica]